MSNRSCLGALALSVFLSGCASDGARDFANGFFGGVGRGASTAGEILTSPGGAPQPLQTDYKCVQDCTSRGYQHQLCTQRCSF